MAVKKLTKAELAKKAAAIKVRLARASEAHASVMEAAKQALMEQQRAEDEAAELAESLAEHLEIPDPPVGMGQPATPSRWERFKTWLSGE